ncbi:hypothetical protein NUF46_004214 [Yersinia enterocolitica]|nr:hypothetical protein [Yersinia enterocolitica]
MSTKQLLDSEGQRFWVDDYGATGDGQSYDDEAVVKAVDAAKKIGGRVVFGAKLNVVRHYRLQHEINLKSDGSSPLEGSSVTVEFTGSIFSTVILFEPKLKFDVLFRYASHARFIGDICVKRFQDDAEVDYKGIVFATSPNKQVKLVANRIWISGKFMFGKFHRFTLWESIERFESFHAKCHIAYSNRELNELINSYETGETNFNSLLKTPPAPNDSWNSQPPAGWFHNAINYGMVYCEGGEVGLYGSPVCISIAQITTQGQLIKDRAMNEILPITDGGTGCYFFGYASSMLRAGITIANLYAEVTERPIYIEQSNGLDIGTMFAQGFYINGNIVNKNNAHSCIFSERGGEINIKILRTDAYFDSIVSGSDKTNISISSLVSGGTWIPNKTVNLSYKKMHEELAICSIGKWYCPRINYISVQQQGETGDIFLVNIDQTENYLINISGSVNGEWIVGSTIVQIKNGIIHTVVGAYDSLIVKRGYSLAVRVPSSASTTRYSALVLVRNSDRNKANMSIAITQTSQGLVRLG